MLNKKEKLEEHFVDIDLEMHLLKIGLTIDCSLDEFETAVSEATSKNFISVWKQVYPHLSAKESKSKPDESIAMYHVKEQMGWSSNTNMQAYLSGSKTIGLSNATRLAEIMGCKVEDIHPLVGNEYLSMYHKHLKNEESRKKAERSVVIGSNISKLWGEYKLNNPKVTQELFCKNNLSIKNQSNFSQMLKGKTTFSKKRVEEFATAFGCSPVEIDPEYTLEVDNFSKESIKQLVSILETKNLSSEEEKTVKLISSSVM